MWVVWVWACARLDTGATKRTRGGWGVAGCGAVQCSAVQGACMKWVGPGTGDKQAERLKGDRFTQRTLQAPRLPYTGGADSGTRCCTATGWGWVVWVVWVCAR